MLPFIPRIVGKFAEESFADLGSWFEEFFVGDWDTTAVLRKCFQLVCQALPSFSTTERVGGPVLHSVASRVD